MTFTRRIARSEYANTYGSLHVMGCADFGGVTFTARQGIVALAEVLKLHGIGRRHLLEEKISNLVIASGWLAIENRATGPNRRKAEELLRKCIQSGLIHRRPIRPNVPAIEAWEAAMFLVMSEQS